MKKAWSLGEHYHVVRLNLQKILKVFGALQMILRGVFGAGDSHLPLVFKFNFFQS